MSETGNFSITTRSNLFNLLSPVGLLDSGKTIVSDGQSWVSTDRQTFTKITVNSTTAVDCIKIVAPPDDWKWFRMTTDIGTSAGRFFAMGIYNVGGTNKSIMGSINEINTAWTPIYIEATNAPLVVGDFNFNEATAFSRDSAIVSTRSINTETNFKVRGAEVLSDVRLNGQNKFPASSGQLMTLDGQQVLFSAGSVISQTNATVNSLYYIQFDNRTVNYVRILFDALLTTSVHTFDFVLYENTTIIAGGSGTIGVGTFNRSDINFSSALLRGGDFVYTLQINRTGVWGTDSAIVCAAFFF